MKRKDTLLDTINQKKGIESSGHLRVVRQELEYAEAKIINLQSLIDKQVKDFEKLDKEMKRLRKFVHNVKHGDVTEALATLANDEIIDEL
jgi:hypothetical protein